MMTRLAGAVESIRGEERELCRVRPARNLVRMSRVVEDPLDPVAGAAVQGDPL